MWDLRGALLKKEEIESARLADFDFRLRARTMRLLAESFGLDAGAIVGLIAEKDDAAILGDVAMLTGSDAVAIRAAHALCEERARKDLIAERGDPAPHRLA